MSQQNRKARQKSRQRDGASEETSQKKTVEEQKKETSAPARMDESPQELVLLELSRDRERAVLESLMASKSTGYDAGAIKRQEIRVRAAENRVRDYKTNHNL